MNILSFAGIGLAASMVVSVFVLFVISATNDVINTHPEDEGLFSKLTGNLLVYFIGASAVFGLAYGFLRGFV